MLYIITTGSRYVYNLILICRAHTSILQSLIYSDKLFGRTAVRRYSQP